MLKMRVQGLTCSGVTLVHLAPPSIVTWRLPSSVPAQMTLRSFGESARAVIVPCGPAVTPLAYLPAFAGTSQRCRARSGLMRFQLCPLSGDFHTAFDA